MKVPFPEKSIQDGLHITTIRRDGYEERHFTLSQQGSDDSGVACDALAALINDANAVPVSMDVFGDLSDEVTRLNHTLKYKLGAATVLPGRYTPTRALRGAHVCALSGVTPQRITVDNVEVGATFLANGVRYCRLCGLTPADISQSREEQTRAVFALMEKGLESAGMSFSDVIRTWFFNHRMLEWYDEFNAVRTAFFEERNVFDGIVPASTGVGTINPAGAALTAGLLAVKGVDRPVLPTVVPSPLQCPSIEYGSAFSRAVEVITGDIRRLFISGTASIEPGGLSVHIGDVDRQIALTLDVVQAIIESRDMKWSNITRSIAYFKHAEDAPALLRHLESLGVAPFPILHAHADICRDDLLFELELDVVGDSTLRAECC